MLKTVACVLEMSQVDGLRSMNNLPPDERQRLKMERIKSIDWICQKLKVSPTTQVFKRFNNKKNINSNDNENDVWQSMQESLQRKEELLREYELDLAKLRQSEYLVLKKSEQINEMQVSDETRHSTRSHLYTHYNVILFDIE